MMRRSSMICWGVCLLLLSLSLLPACSLFGEEGTLELLDNLRRWEKANLHDYDFTLEVLCFCPPYGPGEVTVRNGQVQRVMLSPPVEFSVLDTSSFVLTIDDLFDIVKTHHNKVHQLEVDYDDQLGYPTRIAIDRHPNTADDEVIYRASNVRATGSE